VQSVRNAGAFEMRFWNWILLNAAKGSRGAQDPATQAVLQEMADNRFHYLANLPLRPGTTPLRLAPEYEDWLVGAMRHGANDAYWAPNNILDNTAQYKDIPVYLVGGWYDSWAGNTTANYAALSKALKSDVYLIMGPWIHGAQAKSSHGQVDFGPEAAITDELAWRREWFDHFLKGEANRSASPATSPPRCASSSWARATAARPTRGCFAMAAVGATKASGRRPRPSRPRITSARTAR
jgi:uncharacterized protein